MPNVLFIILISFFTLCISFVSVKGTLSDLKYKKKWWKIITKRGWAAISLTISVIILLIWQNYLSERTNDKKDEALRKEKEKSDSTVTNRINAGVDSNRRILFEDLSKALAKQDLQFDSAQNRIEKLVRDSTNSKTTIYESEDPVLDFCQAGTILEYKSKDTFEFKIRVNSLNAASRNVDLSLFIFTSSNEEKEIFNDLSLLSTNFNYLSKKIAIQKDGIKEQNVLVYEDRIIRRKTFLFMLNGSYTNSNETKKYKLSSIGIYYVDSKKFGFVSSPYDDLIKSFLKKRKLL